jgi:hypothetical protein
LPKQRVSKHIQEISKKSKRSLHYYIISNKPDRYANFIRLWTIPFPPQTNSILMLGFENFLEMVMCRAFQCLPTSSLEEIFGPCPGPLGQYSNIGLNAISPLLQGRSLSPYSRYKVVQLLSDSPDSEICAWTLYRNNENYQPHESPEKLPVRRYMGKEGYCSAFHQAISTSLNFENVQASENIWWPLEVHTIDPQSWFRSTIAMLQQNNAIGTEAEMICPVGSPDGSIGIVFEATLLHDYNENGQVSLPWGLRESGFQASNSLIWPFNLRRYTGIPESFQVQSFTASAYEILRDAFQELIAGTYLRVIIICGDLEDILPTNTTKVPFTLDNMAFDLWIETQEKKVKRIFIRAPIPLSQLWASHGKQAYELTSIFNFCFALTGVTGTFPSFYECSMALALIVRGWADERDKKVPLASPADLEPILRVWLAGKGFKSDQDLLRLAEAAGGSLRYGLFVLTESLPRSKHNSGPRSQRIPGSKVRRRHVIPKELLDSVRSIYNELCPCRSGPRMLDDESSVIPAIDDLELVDDKEYQNTPELDKEELPTSSFFFRSGFKLLAGNRYQVKDTDRRSNRASFTIQHCTISFDMQYQPTDDNFFWVKAEFHLQAKDILTHGLQRYKTRTLALA